MQTAAAPPINQSSQGCWSSCILPEQLARLRHDGVYTVGCGEIHNSVDDDGRGFRARFARPKRPRELKSSDIAAIDLPDRREAHCAGIVAIGGPIGLGAAGEGKQDNDGKPRHLINLTKLVAIDSCLPWARTSSAASCATKAWSTAYPGQETLAWDLCSNSPRSHIS